MGGEDSNHKRDRRATSEPTRTKKAKTLETEQPQGRLWAIFRESYSPKETQSFPKPETREEEKAEEEADSIAGKEGEIPTHIQLQLKDGATVNLYMCRPNGHARVRWQSGRVRTQAEGGVHTERYTSTDGKDPVEQLKNGCTHTKRSSVKRLRRTSKA
jgi:hypothetical protein